MPDSTEGVDGGGALGRGARAEWLDWAAFGQDFQSRREGLRGVECWKLARGQHVVQDSALRDAVARGDWEGAAALVEQQRLRTRRCAEADRARGGRFHCVRVVDEPLSLGLQWELRSLRAQARCGLGVRVVPASALGGIEVRAPLPEVVVLGRRTVYEVVHGADGSPLGAYRRTDVDGARNWADFLGQCYAIGEDVRDYADRRIGDLPSRPGQ